MDSSHRDLAVEALREMDDVEVNDEDTKAITLGLKALTHAVLSVGNDSILLARELHSVVSRMDDGPGS